MNQAQSTVHVLLSDLKRCCIRRSIQWGRRIHAKSVHNGDASNRYVATTLIRMYAKCGSMVDARRVFECRQNADVVSWNALLLGYAENGEGHVALSLFSRMRACGLEPDSVTYLAAIKACSSVAMFEDGIGKGHCLERGAGIHLEVGCRLDPFLESALIDMYSKCGSMVDARRVFDNMQSPDVVSWNALLQGYVDNGEGEVALDLFCKITCTPTFITYIAALKACAALAVNAGANEKRDWLNRGRSIHMEIGCQSNHYVQSALIDMYAKCGSMVEARQVFSGMQNPDVVCRNALLLGYAENGEGHVTLDMFSTLNCEPTPVTYIAALKACTSLAVMGDDSQKREALERGRGIHLNIGFQLDQYVQSTLIDMYAKCGSMSEAHRVFEGMRNPDVACWNALLLGYAENGDGLLVLDMFSRMKARGRAPNSVTYVAAFKACSCLALSGDASAGLERGEEILSEIGCTLDPSVQSTLIEMYANCRRMPEARRVFDSIQKPDVVSWTALLLGYAENGDGPEVLALLVGMKARGCLGDSVTYIAAVKACSLIGDLALGRKFHSEITEFNAQVVTCLVRFYARCGSMVESREVFDRHSGARDVCTWNALLTGYASFGDTESVFELFEAMQDAGFRPVAATFLCVLFCCSHAGLVEKAKEYFQAMLLKHRLTPTVMHYSSVVDVLGRGNQLNEALAVIRKMPLNPDAVTWLTLLGACRKWKNAEIGRMAFQSLVRLEGENAPARPAGYVLLGNLYGTGEQELRTRLGVMGSKILVDSRHEQVSLV